MNISNTSQDVDDVQRQEKQASLQPEIVANNVPNAMLDENT
ncbi:hypothetical protein Tco_0605134, partial [Tanacetum coccineum]